MQCIFHSYSKPEDALTQKIQEIPHKAITVMLAKLNKKQNVSGYVCNHGSPSGERDTASPRGHYGERLQRDSCLKKHMKKHHPLAGDSP